MYSIYLCVNHYIYDYIPILPINQGLLQKNKRAQITPFLGYLKCSAQYFSKACLPLRKELESLEP